MMKIQQCVGITIASLLLIISNLFGETSDKPVPSIYAKQNLVAWCIVPFDGKKRGPAERAAMCAKLGLKKIAYDWRQEHIPTFEQEILEYKKHGLEYFAFWGEHEAAFKLFKKHDLHPQIWVTLRGPDKGTQKQRIQMAAKQLLPLVRRTAKMGSKLGLYNHGGWGGEPENLVAVCEYLKKHHDAQHVGIVYNQHHAHSRIDDFAKILALMKPHLLCLNLNGMTREGDKHGKKILPLGEGEYDVALLKTIKDSGYSGPIGIIGHTQDDVEQRLQDNLDGLEWIIPQLDGTPPAPKPKLRTWSPRKNGSKVSAIQLEGRIEYRKPPITVECRILLPRQDVYNIIVASDTKKSGAHWELFSMVQSGMFTAYTPGLIPDHTYSKAMICDGKPHTVAMVYELNRIQLFVDGKVVATQNVKPNGMTVIPGGLAIGSLVENGLGCTGAIEWVRISRTARHQPWDQFTAPPKDAYTLLNWKRGIPVENHQKAVHVHSHNHRHSITARSARPLGKTPNYSPELVEKLLDQTNSHGNAARGLMVFSAAKSACLSCHKIGKHGGTVGPDLTEIGKQRKSHEIIESVLWPKRHTKREYIAHVVLTADGRTHTGYIINKDEKELVLRDPTKGLNHKVVIPINEVELQRETGSLMPENLTAAMSEQQLHDLLRLLINLGHSNGIPITQIDSVLHHAHAHLHGAASFPFNRKPLQPEHWPHWEHHVNRNRIYDFYAKQADYFIGQAKSGKPAPSLLMDHPGLDGGTLGHWGNQNETTWASDAWSKVKLGSVQAGIFRGAGITVPRGVCVQLGEQGEMACCFNPETLSYDLVWKDGFLNFSSVRHGFLHGVTMDGTVVPNSSHGLGPNGKKIDEPFRYEGFYRIGNRVAFSYRIGKTHFLDSPWIEDGKFVRQVAPFTEHPLASQLKNNSQQWPQTFKTAIKHGNMSPYTIDTIELPVKNPWNIPIFGGGLGFRRDGTAFVCTMHGDVWRVTGFRYPSKAATWKRFASGLHHCQGMIIDDDGIFVLCRDQITLLKDLNHDGEADYYHCFSNAFKTSDKGHDFICGLERDADGHFYTSSGNQGIVRISPDGQRADIMATGFRNPDGIGLTADGMITVPCSEGSWTPASMICAFHPGQHLGKAKSKIPYFGYGGPQNDRPPALPLVYLPRGLDNSSGGQQTVRSDRWGPLRDQLLHFSFGMGSHFLVLRDEVEGQVQGAVVPLPGEFLSGVHRGRFSEYDGQLYVTGMQGWGSYTPETGCFQRVRYTGDSVQLPVGFKVFKNGILLKYSAPLDTEIAEQPVNHLAQCWNYRYSGAYGSPEFSTRHMGMRGHDLVAIKSAHVVGDDQSLFLEMPDLQPVNQLHLKIQTNQQHSHELFATVHKLSQHSFIEGPKLDPLEGKLINPHPILADLALVKHRVPNPYKKPLKGARKITIETGSNLSFATRSFKVKPGERIEFILVNPDVVPHNWALVKPGTLQRVGELSNHLVSDPNAVARHYIPESSDVLCYTDVVLPKDRFTIFFKAPDQPGRYPFLCTFPGHWLVMNGEMVVSD
ncbi:DUF6797 domain-containing protein [Gimesia aquarii]|uniref:Auracyanin-A n=1 Tax=Gimesia aquarii TaxID=2527964 RepID=A0A517VX81_9PLAN|nr:DUF6797 domain-containing protein [Gimesia aquarii]QDT97608.1 Auracyanin-A precursor [Gimesia aquarii]